MKRTKDSFNGQNPSLKKATKEPISEHRLREKIDNYSKTADQKQHAILQKLKNKYMGGQEKTQAKRDKQDVHYAMGRNKGLVQSPHEKIQEARKQEDQITRQKVLKEAKEFYHDNHSLTKKFEQERKHQVTKSFNQRNKKQGKTR